MSSIDERVVEMKFDNDQFQAGVKDTQKALKELKDGLDLKGAGKGLDDLAESGKNFNLSGIAAGVESIASKFNALGAIGFTVLQNLTNAAIAFGGRLVNAVLDPLVEGGKRRALNIEQAKFQFQGLGMDIQASMDAALYAVKGTAFGLDEAAKAAASLGASQVPLEKMGGVLRGISGVAALTGSGYSDIADVFTKVAGQGRLMGDDLNRLASRGLNAAASLGKAMGISEADVRKMVSENKISFEMFADTMNNAFGEQATKASETYTGSLSNLNAALSRIGAIVATANFERLRIIFNALTPQIDNIAAALKPATDLISEMLLNSGNSFAAWISSISLVDFTGGIKYAVLTIQHLFGLLGQVMRPFKDAFREIFPPTVGTPITDLAWRVWDLVSRFEIGEATALKLKNTFKGVFAIIDIGRMILVGFIKMIAGLFGQLEFGNSGFLDMTSSIGEWLVALRDAIRDGDGLTNFFSTLGAIISFPLGLLGAFFKLLKSGFMAIKNADFGELDFSGFGVAFQNIKNWIGEIKFDGLIESLGKVGKRFEFLGKVGDALKVAWSATMGFFAAVGDFFAPIVQRIKEAFSGIKDAIGEAFSSGDWSIALDAINTGLFGALILLIKNFLNGGLDGLLNGTDTTSFMENIQGIFDGLTDTMEAMQTKLKADTLLKIAIAIGVLAASVTVLSLINPGRLASALVAIGILFAYMSLSLDRFAESALSPGMAKVPLVAASLILLGVAVLILVPAVKSLADLDWNGLVKGLVGVAAIMGMMVGTAKLMEKSAPMMITSGIAMVIFAAGVKIMASAVKDFADISWEDLAKGLLAVGAVLGGLALFNKFGKVGPASGLQAIGIVLLAGAMKILASAVKEFSDMQWDEIPRGLVSMAGALGILAVAMNFMPTNMVVTGAGLVVVAYALGILSDALKDMGSMGWDEIAKAGVVLLGSLTLIAAALYVMTGTLPGAAGLIIAAAALLILAPALKEMATLNWEEIGKVMVILFGALVILAVGLTLMVASLPGALALVVVAGALAALAPVLKTLGGLEWDVIGKGLLVLASALGIIAVGGILLIAAMPGLLGLGIAIGLIGAGIFLATAGIVAFSGAIIALSAAGLLSTALLKEMIRTILEQIPYGMEQFALGIVAFAGVIAANGTAMTAAFTAIIQSFLTSINTLAPQIINTMWMLMMRLADKVQQNVPVLVDKGLQLVTAILRGLAQRMPALVTAAADLIIAFIQGVQNNLPRVIQAGINLIISFVNGLASGINRNAGAMREAGGRLALAIVDGMTFGLASGAARVISAAANMAGKALAAAEAVLGINSPSKEFFKVGMWSAEGAANGLDKGSVMMSRAAEDMGSDALSQLKTTMDEIAAYVSSEMDTAPVIRPVVDLSAVRRDASQMSGIFGTASLSVGQPYASAIAVERQVEAEQELDLPDPNNGDGSQNITFVQNNTSPEALDRATIYRNTHNQLTAVKEVIKKP